MLIFIIRFISAYLCSTYGAPDEWWQGPEVAHRRLFGYGFLTWEWAPGARLRSWVHPLLLSPAMWLAHQVAPACPSCLMLAARMVHAAAAAVADVCVGMLAGSMTGGSRHWSGSKAARSAAAAGMFFSLTHFWSWSLGARTLVNSLESASVAIGAAGLLAHDNMTLPRMGRLFLSLAVGVVTVWVRPTAVLPWAGIGLATLATLRTRRDVEQLAVALVLVVGCIVPALWYVDALWGYGEAQAVPALQFFAFNSAGSGGIAWLYGTSAATWYLTTAVPVVLGPLILLALGGVLRATPRGKVLAAAIPVTLGVLSLSAHKEMRFIAPLHPICAAYAGACIGPLYHKLKQAATAAYQVEKMPIQCTAPPKRSVAGPALEGVPRRRRYRDMSTDCEPNSPPARDSEQQGRSKPAAAAGMHNVAAFSVMKLAKLVWLLCNTVAALVLLCLHQSGPVSAMQWIADEAAAFRAHPGALYNASAERVVPGPPDEALTFSVRWQPLRGPQSLDWVISAAPQESSGQLTPADRAWWAARDQPAPGARAVDRYQHGQAWRLPAGYQPDKAWRYVSRPPAHAQLDRMSSAVMGVLEAVGSRGAALAMRAGSLLANSTALGLASQWCSAATANQLVADDMLDVPVAFQANLRERQQRDAWRRADRMDRRANTTWIQRARTRASLWVGWAARSVAAVVADAALPLLTSRERSKDSKWQGAAATGAAVRAEWVPMDVHLWLGCHNVPLYAAVHEPIALVHLDCPPSARLRGIADGDNMKLNPRQFAAQVWYGQNPLEPRQPLPAHEPTLPLNDIRYAGDARVAWAGPLGSTAQPPWQAPEWAGLRMNRRGAVPAAFSPRSSEWDGAAVQAFRNLSDLPALPGDMPRLPTHIVTTDRVYAALKPLLRHHRYSVAASYPWALFQADADDPSEPNAVLVLRHDSWYPWALKAGREAANELGWGARWAGLAPAAKRWWHWAEEQIVAVLP